MQLEPKSLYTKGKSNNLGKFIGKWKVKRYGTPLSTELYQKGLVEISGSDSFCRTIQYDFDLKFSFTKAPPEIKF